MTTAIENVNKTPAISVSIHDQTYQLDIPIQGTHPFKNLRDHMQLWASLELKPTTIFLLTAIYSTIDGYGRCRASIEFLEKHTRLSRSTIQRELKSFLSVSGNVVSNRVSPLIPQSTPKIILKSSSVPFLGLRFTSFVKGRASEFQFLKHQFPTTLPATAEKSAVNPKKKKKYVKQNAQVSIFSAVQPTEAKQLDVMVPHNPFQYDTAILADLFGAQDEQADRASLRHQSGITALSESNNGASIETNGVSSRSPLYLLGTDSIEVCTQKDTEITGSALESGLTDLGVSKTPNQSNLPKASVEQTAKEKQKEEMRIASWRIENFDRKFTTVMSDCSAKAHLPEQQKSDNPTERCIRIAPRCSLPEEKHHYSVYNEIINTHKFLKSPFRVVRLYLEKAGYQLCPEEMRSKCTCPIFKSDFLANFTGSSSI